MPYFSPRDLRFQLFDVLQVDNLKQYAYYQDHDRESMEMVLDAAEQIATKMLYPLLTVMDRQEPQLVNGKIRVHEGMKAIVKKYGDDGWINAPFTYEEGGQQLPGVVHAAAGFIFQAANYSASVYPFLTSGAANLIRAFASQELIDQYTPNLYNGRWQGTMALTEPDAGSSLTDISTTATPTDQAGVYHIQGQKIFISCGDHDACENVIHLLLARIPGSPLGVKGISLFVVPQTRLDGTPNHVQTAGVYHKMGYKGAPIAHLMFGSDGPTEGYLVGEANKGLSYMFQMMNEARIGVGMNAAAIGTAAYYASLAYAKERPQGRKITEKDPAKPQIPIIEHADIKRQLLFQKSVVEGSLSLLLYCAQLADVAHVADGTAKEEAALLLDFLTPIAKSYPSEMACLTTSAAVQILGGAGYTTDFPLEQYYREARIHPIHEGTTGIHGLDFLGRKVTMQQGKATQLFAAEVLKTIKEASQFAELQPFAKQLAEALGMVTNVLTHLSKKAMSNDLEGYAADATLFLEMGSLVAIAWQWLRQGVVATRRMAEAQSPEEQAFLEGKRHTLAYFFEYELIKIHSLARRLTSTEMPTLTMQPEWF